jgi:hypothetical protein
MASNTVFDLIRNRLHARVGIDPPPAPMSTHAWRASEWSHEFERLMKNRMLVGGCRYGSLGAHGKPKWDRISDAKARLVFLWLTNGSIPPASRMGGVRGGRGRQICPCQLFSWLQKKSR